MAKGIKDEHPDRARVIAIMKLVRAAAKSELDIDKWRVFGTSPKDYKADGMIGNLEDSIFLPRFPFESNHSYCERLIFMTNYGYTQMVHDAYGALFSKANITCETSFTPAEKERIEKDFDGQGTGLNEFCVELFGELLRTGRTPVVTDKADSVYTYYLPRENMRNWMGSFDFLTWDAMREKSDGFEVKREDIICAYTPGAYYEFTNIKNENPVPIKQVETDLDYVPIVDTWLGDGTPILKPLSVMDFNLMNLDSEMRRILRNQAGLNILQVLKGTLTRLTDQSLIEVDQSVGDANKWITYPSGSMDSQFRYMDSVQKTIFEISRLRRQKNMAETDGAKKLDFVNTEAVLIQGAKRIEETIRKSLKIRADLLGIQNPKIDFSISRNFDVSSFSEMLDEIIKMSAAGFPSKLIKKRQETAIKMTGTVDDDKLDELFEEEESKGLYDIEETE